LVLIESRLGGNPNLNILPDLILRNEDGSETPEYRTIYGLED
jgi:tRNA1(Val) A37 N6-methylase TrmN6